MGLKKVTQISLLTFFKKIYILLIAIYEKIMLRILSGLYLNFICLMFHVIIKAKAI